MKIRSVSHSCGNTGIDTVSVVIVCRDVGGYPPHGTGPRGFQDQVVRQLKSASCSVGRQKWYYTSAATAIAEAGFETMGMYIQKGIIRSHSTLLRDRLLTSPRRKRGSRDDDWGYSGGNRR